MTIIAETERLLIRQLEDTDEADLYAVGSDPDVARYTVVLLYKVTTITLLICIQSPENNKKRCIHAHWLDRPIYGVAQWLQNSIPL